MDRYKYPKKLFLNFFLRFLGDFVPVLKGEKWLFSDFLLGPKVNLEKYHFFAFSIGTKPSRNRRKKLKKKDFFWVLVLIKRP
jgi:hypothetical protein